MMLQQRHILRQPLQRWRASCCLWRRQLQLPRRPQVATCNATEQLCRWPRCEVAFTDTERQVNLTRGPQGGSTTVTACEIAPAIVRSCDFACPTNLMFCSSGCGRGRTSPVALHAVRIGEHVAHVHRPCVVVCLFGIGVHPRRRVHGIDTPILQYNACQCHVEFTYGGAAMR